ncbi:MAG: hypothetical protein GY750_08185 [Lentisphaerae bacterium]|nr:hypothetical protein [Lentisphaerota bacterium]MCP4101387.1 hypothetical protein [Lentisphaerota bacterium]
MPETKKVNDVLVARLMSKSPEALWSTENYSPKKPLFVITYDISEFDAAPVYRKYGVVNDPKVLPKNLQKIFSDTIGGLLSDIFNATGIKSKFKRTADYRKENVLIVYADKLKKGVFGAARSVLTEDGSPDTPALLKKIAIDVEQLYDTPIPIDKNFKNGASHEFAHAMGLQHGSPKKSFGDDVSLWEALKIWWQVGTPTRSETIMSTKIDDIQQCIQHHPNPEKCADLLQQDPFSAADRIAMQEQVKRATNKSYQSPYMNLQNAPDLVKDVGGFFKNAMVASFVSFTRTFLQIYFKPLLIQKFHVRNFIADAVTTTIQFALEAYLYLLPNVIVANVLYKALEYGLRYCGINPNRNREIMLMMNVISSGIHCWPTGFFSSLTGAAFGQNTAWRVVRKLPKFRH